MFDTHIEIRVPSDFVNVQNEIPEIKTDIRYFNGNNFTGRKINGYNTPVCLMTKSTTEALKKVVHILYPFGLTLKVYDCYRPQSAVNDFISWSQDVHNQSMKTIFYPDVEKSKLFKEGYIAKKSAHSRGSTVDLTIVPVNSNDYSKELDFGSYFDFFDQKSAFLYQNLPEQAKANRLLLNLLMTSAGFNGYEKEWWHFTLINEPYPNTYFDFPVNNLHMKGTPREK
ncbi:M15 family metallopeptidase [Arsenophonus nasoniae]|uniref:D-alanyl-D-alanine dipeptidase n=1 Tax=Arsenophonus nasoniae TaxID=638 RepID=A0AA95GRW6_9GAMM|nr:M15 family metallopeptidase [Arsenophonus nasoniae]WGM03732.1 M15 family metallopeptidase [Arsenophonus nasoniae]